MIDESGFDSFRVHDSNVIDLGGQCMTMQQLFVILLSVCTGRPVLIRNGARETAPEIMHRLELMHIAAHEARVRKERG